MVRSATIPDAGRLAEIHVFGWRNAYRGIVSEDILFRRFSVEKRTNTFRQALEEQSEETYVFEEDGIIKGFMTIGDSRDQDRSDETFELWGIYVDPLMLRNGIGGELLRYCETEAWKRAKKEVTLWVLAQNTIGRNFYEKHGYQPDGTQKLIEHYQLEEIRYRKRITGY